MHKKAGTLQRYKRERTTLIILFLFIPLALLFLLTIYPIVSMLIYSFTDWGGVTAPEQFVGLDNYIKIFTSEQYRNVFRTSGY